MYVNFREREDTARHDLEEPRTASTAPLAPAPVLVRLAVMDQHPRTAETYWTAIGWQAQIAVNQPERKRLERLAIADEMRTAAEKHSVIGRGARLGLIRAKAGLNARQLSRIVGVLPSDVTEWERNLRPIPNSMVPAIEAACKDVLIPTWTAA